MSKPHFKPKPDSKQDRHWEQHQEELLEAREHRQPRPRRSIMAAMTTIDPGRSLWYPRTAESDLQQYGNRNRCSLRYGINWRSLKLREGMGTNPTFTSNRVRPRIT